MRMDAIAQLGRAAGVAHPIKRAADLAALLGGAAGRQGLTKEAAINYQRIAGMAPRAMNAVNRLFGRAAPAAEHAARYAGKAAPAVAGATGKASGGAGLSGALGRMAGSAWRPLAYGGTALSGAGLGAGIYGRATRENPDIWAQYPKLQAEQATARGDLAGQLGDAERNLQSGGYLPNNWYPWNWRAYNAAPYRAGQQAKVDSLRQQIKSPAPGRADAAASQIQDQYRQTVAQHTPEGIQSEMDRLHKQLSSENFQVSGLWGGKTRDQQRTDIMAKRLGLQQQLSSKQYGAQHPDAMAMAARMRALGIEPEAAQAAAAAPARAHTPAVFEQSPATNHGLFDYGGSPYGPFMRNTPTDYRYFDRSQLNPYTYGHDPY